MRLWAILGVFAGCAPSEAQINAAIERGNHCEVVEDCEDVGSVCPFGCDILVHVDEADHVRRLLDGWLEAAETCTYRCQQSIGVACEDFTCVPVYGQ